MSRLTAPPPSSRPARLTSLATHPPSPPDTEMESVSTHDINGRYPHHDPSSTLVSHPPLGIDSPTTRFRKLSSTLSYNSAQGREQSLPRRSNVKASRWLVMVVPPSSLEREPQLGSTLSVGPPGRYAAGLLMPLFPTMYAQLSAIAREFALPSTSGVCIYLRVMEGASQFSPRLSDEAWQILWGPFINPDDYQQPPSYPLHGLPISGKIEFDIDVRKAKWYSTWINGNIRNFGGEVPETASIFDQNHWRSEHGRASVSTQEDASEVERSETVSNLRHAQASSSVRHGPADATPRQGPRKLSLLNRREVDLPSIKAPTKSSISSRGRLEIEVQSAISSHHPLSTPGTAPPVNELGLTSTSTVSGSAGPSKSVPLRSTLSPIPQTEEPLTARQKDLDTIVRKWRDSSATIAPPVLAASPAQPNTPPVDAQTNTTNDFQTHANTDTVSSLPPILDLNGDSTSSPIDLADFAWSISSRGPPSPDAFSSFSFDDEDGYRVPSVHLLDRMRGSVLLTPSTRTSFGPDSSCRSYDDLISNVDRYPSPDIAARMIEDSPPTPSTATSWGPGISPAWAFTPRPEYPNWGANGGVREYESWRLPSPDIADRMLEDSPPTPTTATSWGPSYPDGEMNGYLSEDEGDDMDELERGRTPDLAERMWSPTLPPLPLHLKEESEDDRSEYKEEDQVASPSTGIAMTSDENMGQEQVVPLRKLVWPYLIVKPLIKMGWPYYKSRSGDRSRYQGSSQPPVSSSVVPKELPVRLAPQYPSFVLYPAQYPHLEIYPPMTISSTTVGLTSPPLPVTNDENMDQEQVVPLRKLVWPYLIVKPIIKMGWPYYKSRSGDNSSHQGSSQPPASSSVVPKELPVHLGPQYPSFVLYPAQYPHLEIYPSMTISSTTVGLSASSLPVITVRLPPTYPSFDLYPAGYPHINVYPVVRCATIPPSVSPKTVNNLSVKLPSSGYPSFELYPASYPHNLQNIYPAARCAATSASVSPKMINSISVKLPSSEYPSFDLYPASYPYNLQTIYPAVRCAGMSASVSPKMVNSLSVKLPSSGYPSFDLYPASYPYNLQTIYPAVRCAGMSASVSPKMVNSLSVKLPSSGDPSFDLYPASYPHNLQTIYPRVRVASDVSSPSAASSTSVKPIIKLSVVVAYPTFVLYEPVYPHVLPYAPVWLEQHSVAKVQILQPQRLPVTLPSTACIYPEFNLYPPTYPTLQIYPPVMPLLRTTSQEKLSNINQTCPISVHLTSQYPTFNLYPSVYPYVIPYPQDQDFKLTDITPATRPRRQRKTHQQLHDEVFAKLARIEPLPKKEPTLMEPERTEVPVQSQPSVEPTAPPPAPLQVSRSRARSGTVRYSRALPPPPVPEHVPSLEPAKVPAEGRMQAESAVESARIESSPKKAQRHQVTFADDVYSSPSSPEEERHRVRMELHDLIFGGVPLPAPKSSSMGTSEPESPVESLHDIFAGGQPIPSRKPPPTKGLPPVPPPAFPVPVIGLPATPRARKSSVSSVRSSSIGQLQGSPKGLQRLVNLPTPVNSAVPSLSPRSSSSSIASVTTGTPLGKVWEEDYEARESAKRQSAHSKQPLNVKPMTPVKEAARLMEENEKSRNFPTRSSSLRRSSVAQNEHTLDRSKSMVQMRRPRTNDSFFQQRKVRFGAASTGPQRSMSSGQGLGLMLNPEDKNVDAGAVLMQFSSHSTSSSTPRTSSVIQRPISKLDTSRFPFR
ncbi:hypothetical protein FRC03_012505 [Tulasnella sp. 419]|nr:hypothetical protein FRC03_012505 [Tulasnella sp. 419]